MPKSNLLALEKSPYLLQHKDNPVHWFPWGKDAFAAAEAQDKPIFLSIGYSTCYWCHVMEKDSFETDAVAEVLNRDFISIKIDREERPDIDQIYMDAVVAMTGHGGWPLSIVLTPDLKPFFGGTFFPRDQFISLLNRISELWIHERARVLESANGITAALSAENPTSNSAIPTEAALRNVYVQLGKNFDSHYGGFGKAPKFPPAMNCMLLLRIHRRTGDEPALVMASLTLEHMARGGMYDQLGGGFARYSTDAKWLVPHFEKMLYDNALLSRAYLEAAQLTKNMLFRAVAGETLDYVLREMTGPQGGFYSAQDAGEVGKEGEFYVWKDGELEALLNASELERIRQIYGVTALGNFEQQHNVLNLQRQYPWTIKADPLTESAHRKLLAARNERPKPHLDDKVLVSWNALMISALVKGYQVLGEQRYLDAAVRAMQFIKEMLYQNGRLLRRWRDGEAKQSAFLEDYAYMIQALLDLYENDADSAWLRFAEDLQRVLDERFWDDQGYGYYFTEANEADVLIRKKELNDGAIPSGSGIAALNLLRLYHLTLNTMYLEKAEQIFVAAGDVLKQYPSACASTLIALDFYLDATKEVVIVGDSNTPVLRQLTQFLNQEFLPNKVVVVSSPDSKQQDLPTLAQGKPAINDAVTVYVCEKNTCKAPTTELEQAKKLIFECSHYTL